MRTALFALVACTLIALPASAYLSDGSDEGGEARTMSAAPAAEAGPTTLYDGAWEYASLGQIPGFAAEPVIATFDVPAGTSDLEVIVTHAGQNFGPYADNARLYDPQGRLVSQDAFSDQQVGNFWSEGTATLTAAAPAPGTWTVALSVDNIDQTDRQTGRVVATAA